MGYICLTKDSILDPGTDVYAVGWGFTNNNFYAGNYLTDYFRLKSDY